MKFDFVITDNHEVMERSIKMVNAGFEIISTARTGKEGEATYGVALGEKLGGRFGPEWVTWGYTERNGQFDYYWGHYFRDEDDAQKDFLKRVKGA